jgi:hypothetical protein
MMSIPLFKSTLKLIQKIIARRKYLYYGFGLTTFYPIFVLSFVWWHCYQSPFKGGTNGPLDAYRHTLASAVVAYTTSPKLVEITTFWMENKNQPANLMDQHNNAIGAKIGSNANAFSNLPSIVTAQILHGKVNASNPNQITFLPKSWWKDSVLW